MLDIPTVYVWTILYHDSDSWYALRAAIVVDANCAIERVTKNERRIVLQR
jgi:hypothetical protein